MKLIGIGYKKQSGKDTLATFLSNEIYAEGEKSSVIVHFADALKKQVSIATEIPLNKIEENKEVFRPLLQWWGTEFRKKFQRDDNYWIRQVAKVIKLYDLNMDYVIIPDVRFFNEACFVKKQGGILINITRNNNGDVKKDSHSSETEMDMYNGWDYTVENNGTEADLRQRAIELCKMIS